VRTVEVEVEVEVCGNGSHPEPDLLCVSMTNDRLLNTKRGTTKVRTSRNITGLVLQASHRRTAARRRRRRWKGAAAGAAAGIRSDLFHHR
jgi:hypothetical protein